MKWNSIVEIEACLKQPPDIHERKLFFNSAVILPLIKVDGEYHILFEKRSHHIPQGGEICFPGGRFSPELDQTYQDTALRETEEELGYRLKISILPDDWILSWLRWELL